MKTIFKLFFVATIFINGCVPVTSTTPSLVVPSATDRIVKESIPSSTATSIPLVLPVDRFNPIPVLTPITSDNAKDIKEVGYFEDSPISTFITKDQGKLIFKFESGVELYDLPGLSTHQLTRINTSILSDKDVISEDGKYIARAYFWESTILIWDIEKGEKVCEVVLPGRINNFLYMNFHTSQNTLSVHGDLGGNGWNKVIIYDLNSCLKVFDKDSDAGISSVSSDGQYAAVIEGEQVVIHNTKTKEKTYLGETRGARGVGFLEETGEVAISYGGRTLIYNLSNGEVNNVFDANVGIYYSKISSLNYGKWVWVSAFDKNYFWDTSKNQTYPINSFINDDFTFNNGVLKTDKAAFNLNTRSKVDFKDYGDKPETSLSLDGNYLVISTGIPPFRTDVYEMQSGTKIISLIDEHAPILTKDNILITSDNEEISFFKLPEGELIKSVSGNYVNGIVRDEQSVIIWDALGKLSILDTNTGEFIGQASLSALPLKSINFTRYKNSIAAWEKAFGPSLDDMLSMYDNSFPSNTISADRKTGVQQNKDEIQIFGHLNGDFIPDESQKIASYNFPNLQFQFKFSPDNSMIAGISNQLILWDSETGSPIKIFGFPSGVYERTDARFSPDNKKLALAFNSDFFTTRSCDFTIMVIDLANNRVEREQKIHQRSLDGDYCNQNLPFALLSNKTQIVTLTNEYKIGIYDLSTFEEIKSFGYTSAYAISDRRSVTSLAFALSPNDQILAVAFKNRLQLWDIESEKKIQDIKVPEINEEELGNIWRSNIVFSQDGKALMLKISFFRQNSQTTIWGVPEIP